MAERSRKWLKDISNGTTSHDLEALTLKGIKIINIQKGFIRCNLAVSNRVSDSDGNWHAGAMATIIDDVGAAVIYSATDLVNASVDFSISFFSTAKVEEEVEIEAKFVGQKGKLSHVVVEVKRKCNGELIALGKQWMTPTRGTVNASEPNSKL